LTSVCETYPAILSFIRGSSPNYRIELDAVYFPTLLSLICSAYPNFPAKFETGLSIDVLYILHYIASSKAIPPLDKFSGLLADIIIIMKQRGVQYVILLSYPFQLGASPSIVITLRNIS
jgi:hypothetical protein